MTAEGLAGRQGAYVLATHAEALIGDLQQLLDDLCTLGGRERRDTQRLAQLQTVDGERHDRCTRKIRAARLELLRVLRNALPYDLEQREIVRRRREQRRAHRLRARILAEHADDAGLELA